MNIWDACKDRITPQSISGELVRIVESQEQVATSGLVDNLEEQAYLEDMLERTKPAQPIETKRLHYLLATPFRYPPLAHGSRFGSRQEPGLFYGSKSRLTAFAETAYYRLVFWYGMLTPPPSEKFLTQHTEFSAGYKTRHGLQLQHEPFSAYVTALTDPQSYSATQQLGSAMRAASVDAFEYVSARDLDHGLSVALFSARALAAKRPHNQQAWLCETSATVVSFSNANSGEVHHFSYETFLVNGKLPQPAV